MIKILFICWGNICRSPMAEFVMKDLLIQAGYGRAETDGAIASAATSREEIGNPIYPPARRKLAEHGIGVPGRELGVAQKRARQMTAGDYHAYDLIICMDDATLSRARRIAGGDPEGKISLLLDYAGRPGAEVADPWYSGDFETAYRDIESGCRGLLKCTKGHGPKAQ